MTGLFDEYITFVPAPERTGPEKRAALDAVLADRERATRLGVRGIARLLKVDPSWVSQRQRKLYGTAADPKKAAAGKRGNTIRAEKARVDRIMAFARTVPVSVAKYPPSMP